MERLLLKETRNLLVSELTLRYSKILCKVIAQEMTDKNSNINKTIWAKVPIPVIIW